MGSADEVATLLRAQGGVLRRRDRPELSGAIDWLIRQGKLSAVLPGIYCMTEWRQEAIIRLRAVMLRHPDGVLIKAAAARVSYWPDAPLNRIELAVPHKVKAQPGFAFHQRVLSPSLVMERNGFRFTHPALTALDMATEDCADSIDVALRTRTATLETMHNALTSTANRPGNQLRLKLLLDSREEPWSAAERRAHRLLRSSKITGWKGNLAVMVQDQLYYLDVGFRRIRLALEIDGRIHQSDPDFFESDRIRQNALILSGWRVLRFTWRILDERPSYFIEQVRRAAVALKSDC